MNIIIAIKRDKEFRQKLFGTILILLIVRILHNIPVPGINPDILSDFFQNNAALGFMNILTGSALAKMTVGALSVSPFITVTIITQLMSIVFPGLGRLAKKKTREDEKKMDSINFTLGVFVAAALSFGMVKYFGSAGLFIDNSWYYLLIAGLLWTFGAVFSSGMGKLIQEKFIGNGISLILFMNIIGSLPSDIESIKGTFVDGRHGTEAWLVIAAIFGVVFIMFLLAFLVQSVTKKLPVTYATKLSNESSGKRLNYFPIKLCPGSVIPVIFAGSLFSFPSIVCGLTGNSPEWLNFLNTYAWFNTKAPIYTLGAIAYILAIIGFTFFYNNIAANPLEVAEAIEKRGGAINNKRPGKETANYVTKETNKMLRIGSIIIIIVALTPMVISGLFGLNNVSFLGTSVLIISGVIIETYKTLYAASFASV